MRPIIQDTINSNGKVAIKYALNELGENVNKVSLVMVLCVDLPTVCQPVVDREPAQIDMFISTIKPLDLMSRCFEKQMRQLLVDMWRSSDSLNTFRRVKHPLAFQYSSDILVSFQAWIPISVLLWWIVEQLMIKWFLTFIKNLVISTQLWVQLQYDEDPCRESFRNISTLPIHC